MNNKSFLKGWIISLLSATVFAIPLISLFSTVALANETLVLKLGHPMPEGNNVTLGYEKLKELVEKKSNGKITIEIFPDTQWGSDRVTTREAQRGTLDLTSSSTTNMAGSHKDYMALDLPYTISPKYQDKLFDALDNGELGEYYKKVANNLRLVPLMYSQYGFRNFVTAHKPIKTLEDLKGLKVRTANSRVEVAVAQAFHMEPQSLEWGEVYGALQQGTIDAEGNTFSLLNDAKHVEIIKYATNSAHNYSMHILFINQNKWNSLTEEQRVIITESAKEAVQWQRKISVELEKKAWQAFRDKGIEITEFDEAELAKFKEVTQSVRDSFTRELPTKLMQLITDTQK